MIFYCNGKKGCCDCSILCQDCQSYDESGGEWMKTNGEHIRSMDDSQLAHFLHELVGSDFFCQKCKNYGKCKDLLNTDGDIPGSWCEETIRDWLKAPPREFPSCIDDEKQESGLLEED